VDAERLLADLRAKPESLGRLADALVVVVELLAQAAWSDASRG
jgi:hypothetical protein